MSIGHDLLNVPFPELVSSLATSIAQGQFNLDKNSIEILKIMGNKEEAPVYVPNFTLQDEATFALEKDDDGVAIETSDIQTSMIGAGFQPTFYQFAETVIEVKMAITMTREREYESTTKGERKTVTKKGSWWRGYKTTVTSTPVDAKYSSKYNYTAEGSSLLRTRLVPMPPNSYVQRLLDMKAQAMQMGMELELKKVELALELEKAKLTKQIGQLEEAAQAEADKIE